MRRTKQTTTGTHEHCPKCSAGMISKSCQFDKRDNVTRRIVDGRSLLIRNHKAEWLECPACKWAIVPEKHRDPLERPFDPKAKIPWELDLYAIAYPGQLSPIPYRDPLTAQRQIERLYPSGQQVKPDKFCRTCQHYDRAPSSLTSQRPPGTLERSACAGCPISYLDPAGVDMGAVRDVLRVEWIEAREAVKDSHAMRRHCKTPKEFHRNDDAKARAKQRLKLAADNLRTAGVDPETRFRKPVKKWEATC